MTKPRYDYLPSRVIQNQFWEIIGVAETIHIAEDKLVGVLYELDAKEEYVKFGYRSLTGFCVGALRFSKTQTQRIVTLVRRYDPDLFVERDPIPKKVEINYDDEPYFSSATP